MDHQHRFNSLVDYHQHPGVLQRDGQHQYQCHPTTKQQGAMETSLVYRTDRKHLCVAVKEKLSAGDVQLKFKGLLDTVAGGWENALWLHRTTSFRPSSYSTPQRRGNKYQGRADPRVRLGAGIFIDAKDGGVLLKDDVHLNCRGRAQWQLWDYERHQLDLDVSYNPQGKRIFGRGGFHIHK
ncbi:unnamed protein product, partial [Ostreobium quekettii]